MAAVYYAASAKAVCFGINDATNAFAFFANVAITNSGTQNSLLKSKCRMLYQPRVCPIIPLFTYQKQYG